MKVSRLLLYGLLLSVFIPLSGNRYLDRNNRELAGTWELIKFKYGESEKLSDVPEFVKYVKNLTDSHYAWASYNDEGNVVGAGGGTYEIEAGRYIEYIDYFYPPGSNLVGSSVKFDYKLEGNRWVIWGFVKSMNLDPITGNWQPVDSTRLREVWMRKP